MNEEIIESHENSTKSKILNLLRRIPLACKIFWCIGVVAGICHVICCFSPPFADFMMKYPNTAYRWVTAKITMWIPFSLAEMFIILLPLIIIGLIGYGIYVIVKSKNDQYIKMLSFLLSVIAFFYSSFVFSLAPGYKGTTLDQKLSIERTNVSAEELYECAIWLDTEIDALIDEIDYIPSSFSVMPYDLDEMNSKLNDAYAIACQKYIFIAKLNSNIKYVLLSEPMSYTHITGVYTYFTGEANLNINFPDYTLPYTAAHEFAHQRGTAKEDEANFVAFLVCIESDDAYIKYSAYVNMLEYVMSALASASTTLYSQAYSYFDSSLVGEFYAYSDFYSKYKENKVADVSTKVNDTYLQSQGVEAGSKSYGLVVDLTVAYYKQYSK